MGSFYVAGQDQHQGLALRHRPVAAGPGLFLRDLSRLQPGLSAPSLRRRGAFLYYRLATLHNLTYYLDLTSRARQAIFAGRFAEFAAVELSRWPLSAHERQAASPPPA